MSFKAKKTALCVGLCLFGMISAQQASAATESVASVQQSRQATGRVADSQGPLIGATVMEKGTNNGTVTDFNGNFTLSVKSGATLVISYVGYESQEVKAGENLHITLQEDGHIVNEVVVIGYGTQRREAVTGSVANIGGEKLNQIAATNAAQALQGRVAGVLMTQTSTQPGAEMQIRIRGQRSLSASNDPLIVLDGIPFMGQLSDINPADIKSMDILKDASATAIYGSRGANGVIIITTAKGSQGAPAKVSYNGYVSFKKIFKKYPMMNGPQFAEMRKLAGVYQNSLEESDDTDTDWQDLLLRTGVSHNHDVTVSGATNGDSYSFGAGYYHDESVIPTQQFNRISLRGNFDQMVGKYFHFGLSTNNNYRLSEGNQIGMYGVLSMTPLSSPYDENGNPKHYVHMANDDTWIMTKDVIEANKDRWLNENKGFGSYNTIFAEVKCPWIEGLSYRINIGLNFRSNKNGSFNGQGINNKDTKSENNASVTENQTRNWAIENLLTFDRTFAEKHHVNLVAMYSAEETTFEQSGSRGTNIPAEFFQYYYISEAQKEPLPSNFRYWQSGLISWMGRAMYSYDNKYMATVALRSDASSRLAKGHQWHTYPAISAGWNIAREEFMESTKSWLDNLKFRVGYGETSNQSVEPYSTWGTLSTFNLNFGDAQKTGYYVSQLPNAELGWEYSKTWNFGLDFSMFNGRLSGTLEYYIQKTNDILLDVTMPSTSGVSSYVGNVGKTENKGWELSLNGIIIDNKNGWNWEAGINLYQNRNKLVELASGQEQDVANRWFVGHPIDVIYDFNKIGLWQEDEADLMNKLESGANAGMIKVEYTGDFDANGDPVRKINDDDKQVMDMEPDLLGGFNTTVGYKGFDLTVIGAFQIGGKLISTLHSSNGYLNMLTGRRNNLDVDYWTPENTGAKYPKPGGKTTNDNPVYGSTLGYFNAGYLKVRAITLGYTFDDFKFVKDLGISRLRLYATVQNPFVLFSPFTNECGLDPETNTYANNGANMAVTMGEYSGKHRLPVIGYNTPSTRNFILGLNVTF